MTQNALNKKDIIKQLKSSNNNLELKLTDQKNFIELSKSFDNLFNI